MIKSPVRPMGIVLLSATLVLLAGTAPATAQLKNTPWPTFQHDLQHTGRTTQLGPLYNSGTPEPDDVKTLSLGDDIKSQPVIDSDGTIYVGSGWTFCAIAPAARSLIGEMEEKWCTRLNADVSEGASASIDIRNYVYFTDRDNTMTAFDPASGAIQCSYNNGREGDIQTTVAINPLNGRLYFAPQQDSWGPGPLTATPPAPHCNFVDELWHFPTPTKKNIMTSHPAVVMEGSQTMIYIGDAGGYLHKYRDDSAAATPPPCDPPALRAPGAGHACHLWQNQPAVQDAAGRTHRAFKITAAPVIGQDGTIYIGSDLGLHAVTPQGALIWTFPTKGWVDQSAALAEDGTIYVGSKSGRDKSFYAINPNGTLKWQFPSIPPFTTNSGADISAMAIVAGDGTVYVIIGTTIYALNGQTGAVLWSYPLDGYPINHPSIGPDPMSDRPGTGILYVATGKAGTLYAFSNPRPRPPGHLSGDFNGDGKADILWRHSSGVVDTWLMDGQTLIGSGSVGTLSTDWTVEGIGDFDGDGKADILWRNSSGLLSIWLMDGMRIVRVGSPGGVSTDWTIQGVGDFNGDGKADILWRHTSGLVYVWLMDGTNAVSMGSPGGVSTDWTIQGVGDFNGDGKADILWRHTSGLVYVWLMDGTNAASTGSPGGVSTDWKIQGVGDFNGDGKADILWRHSSGLVYVWLMDGTNAVSTGSPGGVSTDWKIQGVGDFNGDGKADILWRHSSGLIYVWLIDGTNAVSMGSPGSASADSAIQ